MIRSKRPTIGRTSDGQYSGGGADDKRLSGHARLVAAQPTSEQSGSTRSWQRHPQSAFRPKSPEPRAASREQASHQRKSRWKRSPEAPSPGFSREIDDDDERTWTSWMRKRRTPEQLADLAERIASLCAARPAGLDAVALGRALRRPTRLLAPALRRALGDGLILRVGRGRGARYLPPEIKPTTLDILAGTGGFSRLARALGVDRRTILRWRRGAAVSEFHKLRIAALAKKCGIQNVGVPANPVPSVR